MILRPSRFQYTEKTPPISFKDFSTKSIKKYHQSELLLIASNVIWKHFRENPSSRKNPATILNRSFSAKVFSLVVANGNFSTVIPKEESVYELNNQIFHLSSTITDKKFKSEEKAELLQLFQQGTDDLYKITEEEVSFLHFHISVNRLFKAQHNTELGGDFSDCYRAMMIFRHFVARIKGKVDAEPVIRNIFRMSDVEFLKTALYIYICVDIKDDDSKYKPVLKVSTMPLPIEIEEKLKVNRDMIHICLLRLLGSLDDYRAWFKNLSTMHDYYAANSISPLFRKPVVNVIGSVDGYRLGNDTYIIPSPRLFFRGVAKSFYLLCKENERLFEERISKDRKIEPQPGEEPKKEIDVDVIYGEAIEDYFLKFMTDRIGIGSTFKRIERQETVKAADFLIETDKYEIYVELKKAMAGIEAINILRPQDAYSYYCRLMKCCEQLSGSILRSKSNKIKIAIICYDDCFGFDTGAFLGINLKNGKFKKMGIDYIDVFTFDMLEKLIMERNKDTVIPKLIANCELSKESYNSNKFRPVESKDFRAKKHDRLYDRAYYSLFTELGW